MQFTMTIDCDNAAFEGDNLPYEVASLLEDAARKVRHNDFYPGHSKTILDSNGNDVGRWRIGEERS
jgi:hypothetical protein